MYIPSPIPTLDYGFQPSQDASATKEESAALRKQLIPVPLVLLLAGIVFLWSGASAARADRDPAGCTGSGLGISLFTSLPDVHIGDTIQYSVLVFNTPFPACKASEIQAWVVTPDGITNTVTLNRTTLQPGESDYYTNAVSYVVRSQDIQPDGTLRASANDTGTIHQNDTNSRGGGFQGVNTEVNQPCIKLTVQCTGGVGENGAITFTGTVTNCGNNTLVGVTVTNFVNNGAFTVLFPTNLALGQVASFSGSWVPLNPCGPSTATLVAQGSDQFTATPRTVTSSANATCANVLTPGIKVTKVCPAQPVAPGQLLTFSGLVSNTGNVSLTNIVVVNNQPAPNTVVFTRTILGPGEIASFTGSYTAPTNCSVSDTLIASASTVCGVAVTDTVSATCPILTTPQISVSAVCPAAPVAPGGLLTYSGTVRNTGNITLANVVVVSDRPAANTTLFTVATLAPGASAAFTGSYTVPTDGCSATANIKATGQDQCTSVVVTNTFLSTCNATTAPAIAVTLTCPAAPATAGGPITYTGSVRNSGNVPLINVTVVNNQPAPNTVVLTVPSLAAGASANFTASFTAPADACAVSSTVTATGSDNCNSTLVSNSASATCALTSTPSIAVTQVCPASPVAPGSLLTYSGTVRNTGNITLTNVVVLNNLSGVTPVFTAATLAPGQTANFTGSYLAPTNCSSTSTSTATGQSTCGVAVTGSATATCTILTAPQIVVTAVCPTAPVSPGGLLTYSGTVRNAGNVTLANVVVVSDRPAANTTVFTAATLAPGASAAFTGSYTVPTDVCPVTATITAIGKDQCTSVAVTNTVLSTCTVTTAPAIAVTLACPPASATAGGPITYTGTVRNSGNVTLKNVTVVNNLPAPSTTVLTVPSLAPGVSANFTATSTAPADACSVSSTVTVTGSDNCNGTLVSNTASATCKLITTPSVAITQACPASPATPGGLLTYSGTVRNTGDITLTNVSVVNNLSGATPVFTAATLAPGQTANFTGSYLASTNCSITSTVTVTGQSICGVSVTSSATATCSILTSAAIEVTQVCPATSVKPGALLTYSGTVRNSGNTTLTNIVVLDDRSGPTPIFTSASLAPGASANFTGSYLTHTDCCVDSSTVTASGQGCTGVTVSNSVTRTCTLLTSPKIVVTKVCTGPPGTSASDNDVALGQNATQSSTFNRTEGINFVAAWAVDGNTSGVWTDRSMAIADFAPNAWWQVDLGFVHDIDNVKLWGRTDGLPDQTKDLFVLVSDNPIPVSLQSATNQAGVSAYFVSGDVNRPTTIPVGRTGRYVKVQLAGTGYLALAEVQVFEPESTGSGALRPGDLLTYGGTVSNAGDITLTNVTIVNDQPASQSPVLGPITLAPGETVNYTGSYIVPPDFCGTDTVTATGFDLCTAAAVSDSATATCPVTTAPRIAVSNNGPPLPTPRGSLYTFTGTVTNTGNVTLLNVFVVNNKPTNNTPVIGPITLAPGATANYTGSFIVTDFCEIINTVTARGQDRCSSAQVSATSSQASPVLTTPRLTVTQAPPTTPIAVNSVYVFYGSIINSGDVTLTNVTVSGPGPGNNALVLGPIELAPGESRTYTGSYTVPVGSSSVTIKAKGQSICSPSAGAVVTDAASAPVGTSLLPIGGTVVSVRLYSHGSVSLSFATQMGESYTVQYKNSLSDQTWTDCPNMPVSGTGGILTITDITGGQEMRFYRITLTPQ